MKKILTILIITTIFTTLTSVNVFANYTSQFGKMEKNIQNLELRNSHLEALVITKQLPEQEVLVIQEEIRQSKATIENYKKSMKDLEKLSKPEKTVEKANPDMKYVGNFKLTGYCPCLQCSEGWGTRTASGRKAVEGVTVAASKQFPLGTKLYIEGVGYRTVDDRGGAIKGNKLDIYVNSHSSCYNPAYNKTAKVYVVS